MANRSISKTQLRVLFARIEEHEMQAMVLLQILEEELGSSSGGYRQLMQQCVDAGCEALSSARAALATGDLAGYARHIKDADDIERRGGEAHRDALFLAKYDQPLRASRHERPKARNPIRLRVARLMAAERRRDKTFKNFLADFVAQPEDGLSLKVTEVAVPEQPGKTRAMCVIRDEEGHATGTEATDEDGCVVWKVGLETLRVIYSKAGPRSK